MSLSNYPYFIYELQKKITKERSFLSKYFLLSDLFYSSVKYICFLLESEYSSSQKNKLLKSEKDSVKKLKKLLENESANSFFYYFKEFLNANFTNIKKIDNNLKKIEKTGIQTESKYNLLYKKLSTEIDLLIDSINKNLTFELFIADSIIDNQINAFKLTGSKLSSKILKNNFNLSAQKIKASNSLILIDKVSKNHFLIDFNFRTDNQLLDSEKSLESSLNNFSKYILESEEFQVKIIQKNTLIDEDLINPNDIHIKREIISNKLNDFTKKKSGYLFLVGALGTGKSTAFYNFEKDNLSIEVYKTQIKDKVSFKKNIKEIVNKISDKNDLDIVDNSQMLKFLHNIKSSEKQVIIFEDIHLLDKIDDFLKLFPQKIPENIYIFFSMAARENIVLPMLESRELYYLPSFNYTEVKTLINKISEHKNLFNNEIVEETLRKTYGFPLYIKIYLQDKLHEKDIFYINKRIEIENKFKNLLYQFEDFTSRYDKKLKPYARFFFLLLSISKEGFTKAEIVSILPAISNILIENYIDRSSDFLVKVNGRYKLSSYIFEDICINEMSSSEEINFLHNKIIDFFEPWDKKVSSLSLKYLPYHYLQINEIDKLKKLMLSPFTKSKYKLYDQETLEDLYLLINKMIDRKDNLVEIFHFSFLYQRLKDNGKKELLNILDITETEKYDTVIAKAYDINKPIERFYQLLIIGFIAVDNKKLLESRNAIKRMVSIPDVLIDPANSEIIFKLCSEILSKGIFDIINLPRSREDGVNIIKNLKETEYSYKVIEIILKLLDSLPNEIDKSVMLEALFNRIIDFESLITIEKFYKDIILIIEKIKNENIRDRLYHVYILCIIKRPAVHSVFLDSLLEIKNKINTSLFKYLFHTSMSVLFIKLKQEKIAKDFITTAMTFIEDLDNLNHLPFMISSLIFTVKNFEDTYFYDEVNNSIIKLIDDISFNYDSIQNKLNLLNVVKDPDLYKGEIKKIINSVIAINFSEIKTINGMKNKTINNSQMIRSSVEAVSKIKDKRVLNPLIKKLIHSFNNRDFEYRIYLYMTILDYFPSQEVFDKLVELINEPDNLDKKIALVIENMFSKNDYSLDLADLIVDKTLMIEDIDLTELIISLVSNMDKKGLNPGINFPEHIYMLCQRIYSMTNKLRVLSHLSYFLININQKEPGLQLNRRIFSLLMNEDDQTKYTIIKEILENIGKIKDTFRLYYCLSDILVNIYNISHYIKDDEVSYKIVREIFIHTIKLNFSDMKNIFYRTLEVANKTVNAIYKMKLINLVRKYLPYINEKNFMIDILQKSIFISEENFSPSDFRLMTISSLSFLNTNEINYEKGKNLFIKLISEISFSSYEEYISQVMSYTSKLLHRIENKEDSIVFYRLLVETNIYMINEKFMLKTYSDIIDNVIKLADLNLIEKIYLDLIKVAIKIENSYYKSEYLVKLISSLTSFKINSQSLDLINKVFNLSHFIKDEKDLAHFYKSLIISINKSLNMYSLDEDFQQLFTEKMNSFLKSIEKTINDSINDIYLKSEMFSLLGLSYYKFNKSNNQKEEFFKKAVELIKNIASNDNKTGIETLTALRMIATKDIIGGELLLEKVVQSIIDQKDEKNKFNLFEIFYSHKNHISKSESYKEHLESMFNLELNFKSDILKLRLYILAFNYYYENKDINNTYKFIEKAEKILYKDDSYEVIDYKIDLGISLLKINQYNKGSDILISLFPKINDKPKRIMYEFIIKILNTMSVLGESKYKPELFEKIASEAEKINLKEISEIDIYSLAYSYANKNNIDKFRQIFLYINNQFQKEKILEYYIENLFAKEDTDNLLKLIPLALTSPRIIDKIIAYIILNIEDQQIIKDLTESFLPPSDD